MSECRVVGFCESDNTQARFQFVFTPREQDDHLDLAILMAFNRPSISCGFVCSDWFNNIDWNNAKSKTVIRKPVREEIVAQYGKEWKGRIKFFNRQARAWRRIHVQ